MGRTLKPSSARTNPRLIPGTQVADAVATSCVGRFGMFDFHFLLLFVLPGERTAAGFANREWKQPMTAVNGE
ncbi:hypothetical protein EMIT0P218_80024 [Pseudomonas sp. IT-P218]